MDAIKISDERKNAVSLIKVIIIYCVICNKHNMAGFISLFLVGSSFYTFIRVAVMVDIT